MLIEIEQMVDLDQINPNEIIGESWAVFGDTIPKEQYNILSRVLKLLFAIDESMTEIVPLIIATLVNEDLDNQSKKLEMYHTINNVMLEQLDEMGIHLHDQYRGFEFLHLNQYLLEMLLDVSSLEDIYGLADKIIDPSVDNIERFMNIMNVLYDEDTLLELEYHIMDVDERLLTTIAGVLKNDDTLLEGVSDSTITRVKANMIFMDDTLGRQVVTNGSALEGSIRTFKQFFQKELAALSEDTSEEGIKNYVYNLVSLYLVSSVNTASIRDLLVDEFATLSEDIIQAVKIDAYLQQLVLDV